MRNFIFIPFLLIFTVAPILYAQEPEPLAAEPLAEPFWKPQLEAARELVKKEKYLEAEKIYEALLEEELGEEEGEVRNEYEDLEMKLLFSPVETRDSLLHEIMPGDSLYELAKKYGTTAALLQKSNRLESPDRIYAGQKLKVNKTKFSISILKGENQLVLQAGERMLKTYSVATGAEGSTPVGTFTIANKLENPTWYHAGAIVPPDSPKNILGTRWLGFDAKGYGIHGTTLPETVGTQASKGCIRMLNSDVEELYDLIPLGTQVTITD